MGRTNGQKLDMGSMGNDALKLYWFLHSALLMLLAHSRKQEMRCIHRNFDSVWNISAGCFLHGRTAEEMKKQRAGERTPSDSIAEEYSFQKWEGLFTYLFEEDDKVTLALGLQKVFSGRFGVPNLLGVQHLSGICDADNDIEALAREKHLAKFNPINYGQADAEVIKCRNVFSLLPQTLSSGASKKSTMDAHKVSPKLGDISNNFT